MYTGSKQISDAMNHSITPQDDPLHATLLNSDNGDENSSTASSDTGSVTSSSSQASSERLNLE